MQKINYFKLQAKNLFRDWKLSGLPNQKENDEVTNEGRYFDVAAIARDFYVDNENFKLMHAQHIIAKLAGFQKWNDFIGTTADELDNAKIRYGESKYLTPENQRQNLIGMFKDQAESFFRTWKNRKFTHYDTQGNAWYDYDREDFFDFLMIFDFDEEHFTLENAKKIVLTGSGFKTWNELENASLVDLQISKLIYMNLDWNETELCMSEYKETINKLNISDDFEKLQYFRKNIFHKYEQY